MLVQYIYGNISVCQAGLERAKEAGKRERAVCKLRERFGLLEQINSDLTYAVAVNLAEAYHAAQLYSEALNSFTQIVRSKQFPQVSTWTIGDDAVIRWSSCET